VLFSLVLVATSCTAISVSSPSGSRGASPSHSAPTTSPEVAADRLIIGARSRTDGWVVMADGFGVHVAGGGTLQNLDLETGQSSEVAHIGSWDYDFSRLGRYGEGSLWLASGHDLWDIGRPHLRVPNTIRINHHRRADSTKANRSAFRQHHCPLRTTSLRHFPIL